MPRIAGSLFAGEKMLAPWTELLLKIPESDLRIYERVLPDKSPLLDALEWIDWAPFDIEVRKYYSLDVGQPAVLPLIMLKLIYLQFMYRLTCPAGHVSGKVWFKKE